MKYTKPILGLLGIVVLVSTLLFVFIFENTISSTKEDLEEAAAVVLTELPERLMIPSIGVDAPVQFVGLSTSSVGQMDVPDNFTDVAWYKYGPRPGMVGSSVIAGHLNGKYVEEAVFYDLSQVKIDDEVFIIDATGAVLIFKVVDVRTYPHDAPTEEVFISDDGKVRLNLITCAGDWLRGEELYDLRTVVFTELVSSADDGYLNQ